MSRPPKPTELKRSQGTFRPDRTNHLEPMPAIIGAEVPQGMRKEAAHWWQKFAPMLLNLKVLTEADHCLLALLCDQIAQLELVSRRILKDGHFVEKKLFDRKGKVIGSIPVLHPGYKAQSDLLRHVNAMLGKFGMSPTDRVKVTKVVEPQHLARDVLGELRARVKRSR